MKDHDHIATDRQVLESQLLRRGLGVEVEIRRGTGLLDEVVELMDVGQCSRGGAVLGLGEKAKMSEFRESTILKNTISGSIFHEAGVSSLT